MRIAPTQPNEFLTATTPLCRGASKERESSRGWWLSFLWVVCLFGLGGWCFLPESTDPTASTQTASTDTPREYITKPIGEIRKGDIVLSRDEFGNDIGLKRVVEVYLSTADHLRILTFQSFDGAEQTLKTTDDHPFWVVSRDAFVMARFLQPGDQLTSPHGARQRLIRSIYEPHPEGVPVYNFQVEDYHTYYVGDAALQRTLPILVHNASKECGGTGYRVMTDDELKGASKGNWSDSKYVKGDADEIGKKWLWRDKEEAQRWLDHIREHGGDGIITEVPTLKPLDAYPNHPHFTPQGTAVHVPIPDIGPAVPLPGS